MIALTFAAALAGGVPQPASAEPISHAAEVAAFARMMAETTVAFERCPGVELNDAVAAGEKDALHVVDADYFTFRAEAHRIAEDLRARMAIAADPTWCAEAYRRYGPEGTVIKGVLSR